MKKVLATFWLALFLLSVPLFAEARNLGETQPSGSFTGSLELNQYRGVGRIRTRRRIRRRIRRRHMRRVMRRRHMRRVIRRRYRIVRIRRRRR